jgi:hypothetical protein
MTEAELESKICETRARLGTPLANLDRNSGRESRDTDGTRIRSWLADDGIQVEVARGEETTLMFALSYRALAHLNNHIDSRLDDILERQKSAGKPLD